MVLGPPPRILLQPSRFPRPGRPDGGLPRADLSACLQPPPRVIFTAVPEGAYSGRLSMWGSSPTFFFLLRRCLPTRCWFPYAITLPGSGLSSSISGGPEPCSAPSCRYGWTVPTVDLARELRPTTVPESAGHSNDSSNPGPWSGHDTCSKYRRRGWIGRSAGRSIGGDSSAGKLGSGPSGGGGGSGWKFCPYPMTSGSSCEERTDPRSRFRWRRFGRPP